MLEMIGGDYQARSLRTMRRGGVLVSLLQLQPGVADQAAQLGVGVQVLLTEADRGGRHVAGKLVFTVG